MFKWLKGKPQSAPDPRLEKAYKDGQALASNTMAAVDQFATLHAKSIGEGLYGVFDQLVSKFDADAGGSPIDQVRVQAQIFLEELDNFRPEMRQRCIAFLGDMWKAVEIVGFQEDMTKYIDSKMSEIYLTLFERSVDRSAELIDTYKSMGYEAELTKHLDS